MRKLLSLFTTTKELFIRVCCALGVFFIVYVFQLNLSLLSNLRLEKPGRMKLYSPFDFAIIKSEEIREEKQQLRQEAITYFDVDAAVAPQVLEALH